jgi:4-carboxymuconolactone decarboxylase
MKEHRLHSTAPTLADIQAVAPALEQYTRDALFDGLWTRPDLPPRDRSIVTSSALITRDQIGEFPRYLNLALDSGIKPGEISEIITHLAFYAGWGNALSAVFRRKGCLRRARHRRRSAARSVTSAPSA